MTKIDSLLLLSLGELLLVTTLLSILMVVFSVLRKRRDRSAAQRLIARIKEGDGKRQAETEHIAQHQYGIGGRALESLVNKINRQEKVFYQRLINLYLKRDTEALATLHVAFEGATEPYRNLEIPKDTAEVAQAPGDDQSAELVRLKEENERLSAELAISMDTLGRMLSEYASMYAGGTGEELDKEKMLEMFRAEAIAQAAGSAAIAGESSLVEPGVDVTLSSGTRIAEDDTVELGSNQERAEKSAEAQATEANVNVAAGDENAAAGTVESELTTALPSEGGWVEVAAQGAEAGEQIEPGMDLDDLMSLDEDLVDGLESFAPEGDTVDAGRETEKKVNSGS